MSIGCCDSFHWNDNYIFNRQKLRKCYLRDVRPSERHFVGLQISPINLWSASTRFLLRYSCPSLSLRRLDKKRRRQETYSARRGDPACSCSVGRLAAPALRPAPPSTVTPRCSFPCSTAPPRSFVPLLLLCGPLRLTVRALPRPCVATAPSVAS